nr:DUF3108 domain-containing protein [Pelagibacterium limicola]
MKSLVRSLAVLFLLVFGSVAAQAQQPGALAQYVVTLNGINIAYINVRLNLENGIYQLDLTADVAGLAQIVAQGSGAVNSGGRVTASGLASDRFYLETRTSAERFSVEARYSNGTADHFAVSPPLPANPDRVQVTAAHRRGVNDPVASFILRGQGLDETLCNRTMPVFTGIERFDLQLSFAQLDTATSSRTGYQGPVIACAMRYVPIAGHFESSEITAYLRNNQRMMAWFAPLGESGFFIPYRVLIGTSFGDLSLVLTSVQ